VILGFKISTFEEGRLFRLSPLFILGSLVEIKKPNFNVESSSCRLMVFINFGAVQQPPEVFSHLSVIL